MTTIYDLKVLAASIEDKRPIDEREQFPLILVWIMKPIQTDSGWLFDPESQKSEPILTMNPGKGWTIKQLSAFEGEIEHERKLITAGPVNNKLGDRKIYKSLDTIVKELKSIFGESCGIQLRGL